MRDSFLIRCQQKLGTLRSILAFDNSCEILLSRVFKRSKSQLQYKLAGLSILIDQSTGDASGTRSILTSEEYRIFLRKIPDHIPLRVLDLGASSGAFALLLKLLKFQIEKICCVEMNPRTFERLSVNIRNNFAQEASILHAAVCDGQKELELYLSGSWTSDSIYSASTTPDSSNIQPVKVQGLSFDQIYARYFADQQIDLCKMDIEGAEYEVLLGQHCSALQNCKYFLFEIHPHQEFKQAQVFEALQNMGFAELQVGPRPNPNTYLFQRV